MTTATIITTFELQVSDITELSSTEELALANRIYNKVCTQKPWEFSKTAATGTVSSDATGSYITTPSDFAYFCENNQMTDNSVGIENNAAPKVIYIINGSTYIPYQLINFSDRRQYVNRNGFAYLDLANSKIRFTVAPNYTSYEFDYVKFPAALTLITSPVFPAAYHELIVFGMAVDNDIMQLSDKAKSYAKENQSKYDSLMADMEYWNSQLILN